MKTLFFDCSYGVSGDMLISSMLCHLNDISQFLEQLKGLSCYSDCDIVIKDHNSCFLKGKTFDIICKKDLQLRKLDDIIKIVDSGYLHKSVKEKSIDAFKRLAEIEGKIHGISPNEVHFHEVGAVDTIFDIVGFFVILDLIKVNAVFNSKINVGSGMIKIAHGNMSVPAPAVCELLKGKKVFSFGEEGERATPTGALLLSTISGDTSGIPEGSMISTGYGFGQKQYKDGNYVKSILVEQDISFNDKVYLLECNIDDMTGEQLGFAFDKLISCGARDVWQQPVYMKKNRVGTMVSVLCDDLEEFTQLVLEHTTTNGIRIRQIDRVVRGESTFEKVDGIRIKRTGDILKPEYEDVKAKADKTGLSLRDIYKKLEEYDER